MWRLSPLEKRLCFEGTKALGRWFLISVDRSRGPPGSWNREDRMENSVEPLEPSVDKPEKLESMATFSGLVGNTVTFLDWAESKETF